MKTHWSRAGPWPSNPEIGIQVSGGGLIRSASGQVSAPVAAVSLTVGQVRHAITGTGTGCGQFVKRSHLQLVNIGGASRFSDGAGKLRRRYQVPVKSGGSKTLAAGKLDKRRQVEVRITRVAGGSPGAGNSSMVRSCAGGADMNINIDRVGVIGSGRSKRVVISFSDGIEIFIQKYTDIWLAQRHFRLTGSSRRRKEP
ncbi:MAG: hypothetical protein U5J62_06355 [Desulfurivibrio sp.]|nr:hypothetical protein [Desulfurivibrio sp.]